ncbi:hypothetical protein [Sphingomonas sp. LHG3406-1]|uniref:hypothetical protein n=1 Tax=Sphingomonas sp. LHG3406-1 TaxID=2804617 RepID=UPI002627B099|nr:hypothetical protein [Sphingomonas sp. LHG3406-1]
MTIEASDDIVHLVGRCGAEEAEGLLQLLLERPRPVNLARCEYLHTALVQIVWASGVGITSDGAPLLAEWLCRLLDATGGRGASPIA